MNLSPNKIYPAADSLIQCQGFYKWCMNKIFQDRLLKLVSIVNVDAVFRSINDQFFLKAQKKRIGAKQSLRRINAINHRTVSIQYSFQFSKHIVSVDIQIYIFQMLLTMRIDYILLIKF